MSNQLSNLTPGALWENFENLCRIPHPSKKEGQMVEFVKEFGEKLGLKTLVDEVGNVIIKKPATSGMENKKTVVLQGHLDMVPQKNSDVKHDFEKDPIQAYVDGDWVCAKGTTLGSDNGIGVAAAMSILQSKDVEHGPIEALFTIDEETGMTGANGLKPGLLDGNILINMDSEDEGEIYIGCAGGVNTNIKFVYKEESVPANAGAFKINVTGLKGGHSGLDIQSGRGNSNKIINRLLWYAGKNYGLRLANIQGGSLRNAIPRESYAVVTVPKAYEPDFMNYVNEFTKTVKKELSATDAGIKIEVTFADMPKSIIAQATQDGLFNGIYSCANGVIGMSAEMPGVVETSTNLAIVKSEEGYIKIETLQRSSVDSLKDDVANMLRSTFELAGAEVEHSGSYPGWKPNVNSSILNTMKKVYNDKFGKVPEVKVIHAGLECGIIGDVYPDMDLISFGPTIRNPHSPDEKVNIESVNKFWIFLLETLKNIPNK